jgi:hypothetical protein
MAEDKKACTVSFLTFFNWIFIWSHAALGLGDAEER